MHTLYIIIVLLLTLVSYNCQTDSSTIINESDSSYQTANDLILSTQDTDVTGRTETNTNNTDAIDSTPNVSEENSTTTTFNINQTSSTTTSSSTTNNLTNDPQTSTTTTNAPPTTTTTTNEPPPSSKPNLGLILGLILGINIPVLLAIVIGFIYYRKRGNSSYNVF